MYIIHLACGCDVIQNEAPPIPYIACPKHKMAQLIEDAQEIQRGAIRIEQADSKMDKQTWQSQLSLIVAM